MSEGAEDAGKQEFAVEKIIEAGDNAKKEERFGRTNGADDKISGRKEEEDKSEREADLRKADFFKQFVEKNGGKDA